MCDSLQEKKKTELKSACWKADIYTLWYINHVFWNKIKCNPRKETNSCMYRKVSFNSYKLPSYIRWSHTPLTLEAIVKSQCSICGLPPYTLWSSLLPTRACGNSYTTAPVWGIVGIFPTQSEGLWAANCFCMKEKHQCAPCRSPSEQQSLPGSLDVLWCAAERCGATQSRGAQSVIC